MQAFVHSGRRPLFAAWRSAAERVGPGKPMWRSTWLCTWRLGVRASASPHLATHKVLLFYADFHLFNAHLFLGERLSPCLDRFLDDPSCLPEFIAGTRFGIDLISFGRDERRVNAIETSINEQILEEFRKLERPVLLDHRRHGGRAHRRHPEAGPVRRPRSARRQPGRHLDRRRLQAPQVPLAGEEAATR